MAQPKLPVWRTIFEAYRILFRNLGTFARLSWLPFLVVIAGTAAVRIYFRDVVSDVADSEYPSLKDLGDFIEIVLWFVTIPLATAWMRLILLPRDNMEHPISLRIRREEILYLCRYLVLFLIFIGILILPTVVIGTFVAVALDILENFDEQKFDEFFNLFVIIYITPAAVAALLVLSPLLLVLPAAAIGQPSSLRVSRRLSKGNFLRIGLIFVIASAPEILELFLTGLEETPVPSDDRAWSDTLLIVLQEYCVSWVFFTITVASLALIYTRLAGDPGEKISAAAP